MQFDELSNADRSLFPPSYTVSALRDSRYNNTGYAIAELIDNSVEANSTQVELLCMERYEKTAQQERRRVSEIAVLDNGSGMDAPTLLLALRFGGGTRHDSIRGIGKYGMGLPTSSLSKCKRVDVWTWQDGLDSVWHSSIDADAIAAGDYFVPKPDQDTPIPESWRRAGSEKTFQHGSGTLVVWSNLDKIKERTGTTIINHTFREVGRIHRHFIHTGKVKIKSAYFLYGHADQLEGKEYIVANDPLYLMHPSSVPEVPWDKEPMFKQWGETKYYPVEIDGQEHTIEVQYSIVRPEALKTESVRRYPGRTPRGVHARHNIGVSIVREGREIVLETAFRREGGSAENPQNRWWGCEVHFGRGCDELFGLDHNKQMVAHFTQAAKTLAQDDRPNQEIFDEMGIDEDPIYAIVGDIKDETRAMMDTIKEMFSQRRNAISPDDPDITPPPSRTAELTATVADREHIETGQEMPTQTDIDREKLPPEDRIRELASDFMEAGQAEEDAQKRAIRLVEEKGSYAFSSEQLDGHLMFNVRRRSGVLRINLNTDHQVYELLSHIEDKLDDEVDRDDPSYQATVLIRLLLSSWARMEDQTESRDDRTRIQEIAFNWGRQVDKVLRYLREKDN